MKIGSKSGDYVADLRNQNLKRTMTHHSLLSTNQQLTNPLVLICFHNLEHNSKQLTITETASSYLLAIVIDCANNQRTGQYLILAMHHQLSSYYEL